MFEAAIKNAIESRDLSGLTLFVGSQNVNLINLSSGYSPLSLASTLWQLETNGAVKAEYKKIILGLISLGADIHLADQNTLIPNNIIGSDPDVKAALNSKSQSTYSSVSSELAKRKADEPADIDEVEQTTVNVKRAKSTSASVSQAIPQAIQLVQKQPVNTGVDLNEQPKKIISQTSAFVEPLKEAQSSGSVKSESETTSTDIEDSRVVVSKNREPRFIISRILSNDGDFEPCFREVIINTSSRPATSLKGEGQGDHTTAYIAIMEMLFSAIAGENIQNVPTTLCELAKCFLAESDYKYLEEVKVSFTNSLREHVINRSERKELTSAMRVIGKSTETKNISTELQGAFTVIERQRKKVKEIIKEQEQVLLLEGVCQISETIVKYHQNDFLAVVTKKRVEGESARPGSEGNRVKFAMLNFKLLNHLIDLKNKMPLGSSEADKKAQQEILGDYQEIFTDIIHATKPTIKLATKINENFNAFLEQVFSYSGKKINLAENKTPWPNQIDLKTIKFDALGRLFNDLFDFRYVADDPKQIAEDRLKLPKVAAKHVVCLFMAFKQLNCFDQALKESIVLQFAQRIIEDVSKGGQGWKGYSSGGNALDPQTLYRDMIKLIQFGQSSCQWIQESSTSSAMTPRMK